MGFPLLLALTLTAAPPSLQEATVALDELKYDEALKLLPPEAEVKGFTRDELISWFSTRALALLNLKRDDEAKATFNRLFVFAPDWKLPDHYGPRVQTLVGSSKAEADGHGLVTLTLSGGTLKVTKDKLGVATGLEIFWKVDGGAIEQRSVPLADTPAPWPTGKRVEAWARVVGMGGSSLVDWGSEASPQRIEAPVSVARAAPAQVGLGAPAFIGLGALVGAAAAAVAGTAFAVSSQDAEKAFAVVTRDAEGRITSLTQRQALALDNRSRSDATAAGIFFTVAAGLAATGTGLILFDRISATPSPGGIAFTVPLDATFAVTEAHR